MCIVEFSSSVGWLSTATLAMIVAASAWGVEPTPERTRQRSENSTDKQLGKQLDKQLDEQLLEDLRPTPQGRRMPDPVDDEADKPHAGEPAGTRGVDEELLEGLEGEDVSLSSNPAEENPLVRLNQRMKQVERRIADARGDEKTQRLQHDISDDLSKLIAALDRQCRQSKKQASGSSRQQAERPKAKTNPSEQTSDRPAEDSSDRTQEKETAKVDRARMQEMLKDVWGHLPVHLRQQMEQSANEEFLPKYELEIAEYYRSLLNGRREKK